MEEEGHGQRNPVSLPSAASRGQYGRQRPKDPPFPDRGVVGGGENMKGPATAKVPPPFPEGSSEEPATTKGPPTHTSLTWGKQRAGGQRPKDAPLP